MQSTRRASDARPVAISTPASPSVGSATAAAAIPEKPPGFDLSGEISTATVSRQATEREDGVQKGIGNGWKAVAIACALAGWTSAASAAEFRVLSSWDATYPARGAVLERFLKGLETASKGDMKFTISGPETIPPFEQLQPTGAGAFQILFTHGAYHFGTTPYLVAIEGLGGDLKKWRETGVADLVDKHYQRFGLKLISLPQTPEGGGYHIMLRAPVGPSGDLQGRKIRGTQSYSGVFNMLGVSPVVLPPNEIYQSLEKGIVDGAAWPVLGALGYRWYEVAKHLLRPSFGTTVQPIFMNLAAYNRLTDAQKKLIAEESRKIEDFWYTEAPRLAAEEEKELIAKGAQVTDMGAAQKAKLASAWAQGVFDLAMPKLPKEIGELRDFSKSKGLLQ
jgi:TRAP-type C4-dicarboxylate transport system substrate-binding protein